MQLTKMNNDAKTYRNTAAFYDRMKTEFPDLTPLDLLFVVLAKRDYELRINCRDSVPVEKYTVTS